ncbi:MAG: hypothetical protein A2Z09_01270 [Nitrospirae bacterium RBG_16_43_8]|nr:MAG: hypothetical protein A2Z09_01270 [Nitrospirae bacterium RBG_16_43_8]
MAKTKEISVEDIEHLIENKVLEMLGDPDSGLQLKKEFKAKLEHRLKKPSRRISHEEAMRRFV